MAAPYFLFKQFVIAQQHCGMKVTGDAILFGASVKAPANARLALDIGCGTGLLGLMLAQRHPYLKIDGIELDPQAAFQAAENVRCSRFKDRIDCYQGDVREWQGRGLYDFIICNPPFYNTGPVSKDVLKRMAWHAPTLTLNHLITACSRLLKPDGRVALLFPETGFGGLHDEMQSHLFGLESAFYFTEAKNRKRRIISSWKRQEEINEFEAAHNNCRHFESRRDQVSVLKDYLLFA